MEKSSTYPNSVLCLVAFLTTDAETTSRTRDRDDIIIFPMYESEDVHAMVLTQGSWEIMRYYDYVSYITTNNSYIIGTHAD